MGEKSRSSENDQDLGHWPSRWMRSIKEEGQKRGVAEDRPHGYRSLGDLEEAWVVLGRMRASALQVALSAERLGDTVISGARNQIVMLARGWELLSVARH